MDTIDPKRLKELRGGRGSPAAPSGERQRCQCVSSSG